MFFFAHCELVVIFCGVSDPRTSNWPLMASPFPTLFMVVGYLYTVLILGPTFMDNRKPFKLREILIVYNAAQVIYSAAMFYEVRKLFSCLKDAPTKTSIVKYKLLKFYLDLIS